MSTPTFSVNEAVLCYHGPLIYEAKVLKVEDWNENTTNPAFPPGTGLLSAVFGLLLLEPWELGQRDYYLEE